MWKQSCFIVRCLVVCVEWQTSVEREGEKKEMIEDRKPVRTTPPAPTARTVVPYTTIIQISRPPRHWKLPSTIARPRPPRWCRFFVDMYLYEAPFYYKIHMLWYHKFYFVISKNILWYHKFNFVISHNNLWYHKIFYDITKKNLWYQKIIFVTSQIRICDIKKSSLFSWYHKIDLWYHIFDFVMSQIDFVTSINRFCDIKKSILWYHKIRCIYWYHIFDFVISQNRLCDITS